MTKTKKRNRAAQEATLINLRALKKKVSATCCSLEALVVAIYGEFGLLGRIQKLELASRSKKER